MMSLATAKSKALASVSVFGVGLWYRSAKIRGGQFYIKGVDFSLLEYNCIYPTLHPLLIIECDTLHGETLCNQQLYKLETKRDL